MSQRGLAQSGPTRQDAKAAARGPALSHAAGNGGKGARARPARLPFFSRARSRPRSAGAAVVAARPARGSGPGAAGRAGAGRPRAAHSERFAPAGVRERPAGCPAPQDLPGRRGAARSLPSSPSFPRDRGPRMARAPRWLPQPFRPAPAALRPRARPPAALAVPPSAPGLPTPAIPGPAPPSPLPSVFPCELLSVTSPGTVLGSSPALCPPCPFLCCFLSPCSSQQSPEP